MKYSYGVIRGFICILLISLVLLTACGTTTTSSSQTQNIKPSYTYVDSVDISADAIQADIEAEYGGDAVVFNPEAGYALLGFNVAEDNLTQLASVTYNKNHFIMPEATAKASGWSAWAGGHSAWAGGWSTWAGGWSAWAGGGSVPSAPQSNATLWNNINLSDAYRKSDNYGEGVVVAVIDTGVDVSHPMMKGRLVSSRKWRDFVGNDGNPSEVRGSYLGHGTAVAGLILQVAPKAKIMPLRALKSDGSGDVSDVIAAIDWAVRKGADIINLSLGTMTDIRALQNVVSYAASKDVYIVASAGNENQNTVTYPGQYATDVQNSEVVLSVGSINSNNRRSQFSNYGNRLEVVTVGEGLYSAYPGNKIAKYTGTSFAAPIVSGALALGQSNASSTNKMRIHNYLCNSSTYVNLGRCGRIDLSKMMDQVN